MSAETWVPGIWDAKHLRLAIDASGVTFWSWNVDNDLLTMDECAYELWGVPHNDNVTFEDLSAHIHPSDRDRVRAAFAATRAVVGDYEIDFRIIRQGDVRWISARGQGRDVGIVGRMMYGIFLDVTGRKQAEEAHELLAGEMSHRVKNLLAIASALTTLTSRSAATTTEMATDLIGRLTALGRAHDLVRPAPDKDEDAALLGDLFSVLLAPYEDPGAFSERIRVSVPRITVGRRAATNLALIIHELATNSLKHGALFMATGTLDVSCTANGADVAIVWAERGGPAVSAPEGDRGYGSKLLRRGMTQLGGSITFDWPPEGAIITLSMLKGALMN